MTAPRPGRCFLGVDVGTGSARAGVFDAAGDLLASAAMPIALFRDGVMVEQSGEEIWAAAAASVRGAVASAGVDPAAVAGIGFDATCSLVVVGAGGVPLPVGDPARPERNIIVWMDHRATDQARRINATRHPVLRYVGDAISPEMETPKLLWLKENRPEVFAAAWQFFDLTDFLTFKATGSLARSSCTLTCKWTYLAHEDRFDPSYFRAVGLGELADEEFGRIGAEVVPPGTALSGGLSAAAADAFGLAAGTPVAAGLIDAHAGGIGTVGALGAPTESLGYVFGTSSCTMTTTREPVFVPGVWGPYYSAMVPGAWLNEGGQSAAGAAIDHLVTLHPAAAEARAAAAAEGVALPVWLGRTALRRAGGAAEVVRLADGIHVVPEFLGNRAPYADPDARAVIAGLGMDSGVDSLVGLYVAGLCGIAYGLRQIIEVQAERGAPIRNIMVSGGAGQSELVRRLLADATGTPVIAPRSPEPVLLGAAILGAAACGAFAGIPEAMAAMSSPRATFDPAGGAIAALHDERFRAFALLQQAMRQIGPGRGAPPASVDQPGAVMA